MNKIMKLLQIIKLRRWVLGKLGKGNQFRPKVFATSVAVIGNYNYFGDRSMVGNAVIGNYCSFAPDVKIAQSQHAISYITTYQRICSKNIGYSLNQKPAVIDNDVWLGANVVVMQGVHIGNGAVVGANAVVTHDIPPYAIAVGIPARVIKYRFDEEVIQKITDTGWWSYDLIEAAEKVKQLENTLNLENIKGGF